MQNDFRVIVFISGRGSNLQSLTRCAKHFNITHVLSNKPEAKGLEFATEHGITPLSRARKDFPSVLQQKEWLYEQAVKLNPDLIVLAGYMQILEPGFVEIFSGKIVNIHPSLLPQFPGLDTHARALASGVKKHGCTVHYVDHEVDTGPIIAQSQCDVLPDDTEATLTEKVLGMEHRLLPWVVNNIATGDILFNEQNEVVYSEQLRTSAKENLFQLGRKI